MKPAIEKIYNLLNEAISAARGITREEGELIFRSNIFQELMFAVNEGDSKKGVKLSDKLERQLGIFEETGRDPLAPEGALPLGKGEKLYFVVFVPGDKRYGKYAVLCDISILGAVSKAGDQFGWMSWDYLRKERPVGLVELEVTSCKLQEESEILEGDPLQLPLLGGESVSPVVEELSAKEFAEWAMNNGGQAAPPTLYGELAKQAPEESKEKRQRDLLAQARYQAEEYLRINGLAPDGSKLRKDMKVG